MILPLLGFVLGLFILIKASDWATDLSVKFSEITGLMKMTVGMIILALMTSLPELAICLSSSFSNASHVMFGTVLGSNIADVLLVLGMGAVLGIKISKENSKHANWIMLITSGLLVYGLIYGFNIILGLLSVIIFGALAKKLLTRQTRTGVRDHDEITKEAIILVKLLCAVAIVFISAEFVTLTTVEISNIFGLTQTFIGATIIAITTSLPELAITFSSVRKKQFSIGIGNIFGSCFINVALILGLGIIIAPVAVGLSEIILFFSLILSYFVVALLIFRESVDRFAGLILLLFYVLYLILMGALG